VDEDVDLAADRILNDKDLKKIKILKLKEGVKRVDRHGFRDDDEAESAKQALRDEYYHKMLELLKKRGRAGTFEDDQDMSDEDDGSLADDEAGESEMDEQASDQEEGEYEIDQQSQDEFVSDDGDKQIENESEEEESEEMPEVIPIDQDEDVRVNNERKESSNISDIDVDDYDDSEDYDTDELEMQDQMDNQHGFVYGHMLETYSKSKKDRIEEMREGFDKKSHRDKFKKNKESKNIGKTEKMHAKNKPFMMMKKKKLGMLKEKIGN